MQIYFTVLNNGQFILSRSTQHGRKVKWVNSHCSIHTCTQSTARSLQHGWKSRVQLSHWKQYIWWCTHDCIHTPTEVWIKMIRSACSVLRAGGCVKVWIGLNSRIPPIDSPMCYLSCFFLSFSFFLSLSLVRSRHLYHASNIIQQSTCMYRIPYLGCKVGVLRETSRLYTNCWVLCHV